MDRRCSRRGWRRRPRGVVAVPGNARQEVSAHPLRCMRSAVRDTPEMRWLLVRPQQDARGVLQQSQATHWPEHKSVCG